MNVTAEADQPDRHGIYVWINGQGRDLFVGMNEGAWPSDTPHGRRFCFVGKSEVPELGDKGAYS